MKILRLVISLFVILTLLGGCAGNPQAHISQLEEKVAALTAENDALRRQVQELARQGHPAARRIFRDMGVCLAHTLALYAEIYPLRHVMVLGRVASGIGGEWMTETCRRVLAEEYPQLPLEVLLPDDRFRRIGQSVAAASLPQVRP